MSNIRTNLPVPTEPWENAKANFLRGLSPGDAARFNAATPENLFYDASTAQKKHAERSRSWLMQERVSSLVEAINDYGKALDVYSNSYGLILSPIWGSTRIVLQIAGEAGKFQENIVEMLAQVGDVLPRFKIYQALFSDHERLLVALSNAFLDLLKFCTMTKDFFLKGKKSMIPLAIVLRGAWKPFRQDFDTYMRQFRLHCKTVEREANAAHMIESARIREVEIANRALQLRNNKLQKRHRILCAITTVNYWSQQTNLSASRHPGTNEWIQDTQQYKYWMSSPTSDCLCFYGIPGSGKSVLAASIVDDLSDSTAIPAQIVLYHYCDYAQTLSLGAVNIIYSLIKQLIERLPLDHFTDTFQCPFDEATTSPNFRDSLVFFKSLIQQLQHVYIILDGLDQLSTDDQSVIVDFVKSQLHEQSSTVKILVTSRLNEYIIEKGLKAYKTCTLSRSCTSDMRRFVLGQINSIVQTRSTPLEDALLKEEVIKALLTGANGMFLWLKFQLLDIARASTKKMLRNIIHNFPKDLNETYEKILAKVLHSSRNDEMRTVLVRVFRWVLGARRPLTVTELEEAIGLDKNDNYLHFDRVARNSGERLIANCGNLVILNESDSTVAFAHHTVQQYLCSVPSNHPLLAGDVFSLENASHEIGQICLAYLSFSDFETQLLKVATNPVELKKAEDLVWSNVPLGKYIKRTLLSSSKSRESATNIPSEEYIRFPLPTRTQSSDILNRKYVMLDYIVSAWIWHNAHLTIHSENWIKFKNVATKRNLRFNFRPWNEREHQIKVQQILSPEKTDWRISDLISRVEELPSGLLPQDISIYCFMMRHGLRSLLHLVDSTSLVRYIERYQSSPKRCTIKQCLEVLLSALDKTEPSHWHRISFWNGHFIFHLMIECCSIWDQESSQLALMNFARTEHTIWAILYGHLDTEEMFLEAILLALKANRVDTANLIMRCHVTTPAQLVETVLLIIREGHARLQIMVGIFLLPIQSTDQGSSELMWKYLFALNHCFDTLDFVSDLNRSAVARFNQFTSRALLALSAGVLQSPTMLYPLWKDLPRARNTFVLEEIDWRSQPYGTAELYHALKPLSGSNLDEKVRLVLDISDMFQSKVLNRNDEKLNNAIKEAGSFFSFEAFENDLIPCLVLALDAHCLNVVETLVPMYIDFLQDFKNQEVAIEIIGAIEYSKKDFSSVKHAFALISWPDQVKEPIKSKHETLLHWRGGVNVWIIDMVLAS